MRALGAVVLIACACGGTQRPRPPEPELVVLDPGAEPRQQLRHAPVAGVSERVEIDFKVRVDSTYTNTVLEQGHAATDSPTVRRTLLLTSQPVPGERDVEVQFVIEDVIVLDDTTDPRVRERVAAIAKGSKGLRGSWRVAPSGRVTSVDVAPPPGATAAVREQLASLRETIETSSLLYPDVPIGIGSRWRVTRAQHQANVAWTTSATYTLRALTAAAATIDVELTASAPRQPLNVEPNRSTRLSSGSSHARGQIIMPLHGLQATTDLTSRTQLDLQIVERKLRIASTVRLESLLAIRRVEDRP